MSLLLGSLTYHWGDRVEPFSTLRRRAKANDLISTFLADAVQVLVVLEHGARFGLTYLQQLPSLLPFYFIGLILVILVDIPDGIWANEICPVSSLIVSCSITEHFLQLTFLEPLKIDHSIYDVRVDLLWFLEAGELVIKVVDLVLKLVLVFLELCLIDVVVFQHGVYLFAAKHFSKRFVVLSLS